MRSRAGRLALVGLACLVTLATTLLPAQGRVRDGTDGKVAGMAFYGNPIGALPNIADFQRLRDDGLNMVMFEVLGKLDKGSDDVRPPDNQALWDEGMALMTARAHAVGLKVAWVPKFDWGSDNDWRGLYVPTDVRTFFNSWAAILDRYSKLAQANDVDLFFMGSEMRNVEQYEMYWRELVRRVRVNYGGKVSYNIVQGTRDTPVRWWDALDVASTSAYWSLTKLPDPTVSTLKQSWINSGALRMVNRLAEISKKPVLIGEIGYTRATDAAASPWDGKRSGLAVQTQANLYQALLEVMSAQPWYAGTIWWVWNSPQWSPRGFPAEGVLRAWYRDGWRPGDGRMPSQSLLQPIG